MVVGGGSGGRRRLWKEVVVEGGSGGRRRLWKEVVVEGGGCGRRRLWKGGIKGVKEELKIGEEEE